MEYLGERLDWLRERLSQLEAAKQQFMRHVSHELKTPLATIHEGAELLADDVVGELNTEQRDIANILTTSTKRLENLIEQLLTYSQANGLPVEGNYVKVDTAGLVAKVIEDNQIRIRARSITVTTNLQPVWIEGYPEQLATIIDNLLSNAIKHSPADGKIHFDLREIGGHMVLEIEDEGPGIPVDERERVFEPFYQGQAVKASGVGGTGLGLAIVSECVARHHGKVEALHPRLGKNGARIRVSIPCRQRE
jgi:two-component system sensor histidine kinase GlrK